jgi:hypothetical protein
MANGATISQYENCHDGVGAVAALAVRELSWGFLTHSRFDFSPDGRTIAQSSPNGIPPDYPPMSNSVEGRFCQALKGGPTRVQMRHCPGL